MLPPTFWAHVDKSPACWLWTGPLVNGYARWGNRRAHVVLWEDANGSVPPGKILDHRCHVEHCVRPDADHVRPVTHQQNSQNRLGARRDSSTGVRNVSFDGQKYVVTLTVRGKRRQYGRFVTLDEAAAAAEAKRMELFTHSDGR
jgi:hypothetical protein